MKLIAKAITWLAATAVVLAGGLWAAGFYFGVVRPQTDLTMEPLSLPDFTARFGDQDFPQTATNIFYARATASMGFAGARFYRFDAPLSDCISYAQTIMEKDEAPPEGSEATGPKILAPLASSPAPISQEILRCYRLTDVNWFDVHTVRSGLHGRARPLGLAHVWVDTERGRLYCYWTD